MIVQRIIAVLMILGSSVLTAWASGDIAFPAVLCILGLLGVQRRFTWDIRPERQFVTPLLLLLLAVLFALHCRYAHVHPDQAAAFAWQTIARYFLASMTLLLFLRPHRTSGGDRDWEAAAEVVVAAGEDGRRAPAPSRFSVFSPVSSFVGLPPTLGLFHLATAMAAGQVLLLDDRYVIFRVSELLSVLLVILYAMAGSLPIGSRTPPRGLAPAGDAGMPAPGRRFPLTDSRLTASLLGLLVVAVNVGWIGGSLLYRHVEVVNFLPNWLSRGTVPLDSTTGETSRVGFSTSGRLSTVLAIKEEGDTTPVLTVMGSNPMYLRAMAFETYSQGAWTDLSYREAISPEQNTPFGVLLMGRTYLFRLHEGDASREVIVRHESSVGDAMFTPLGTCFVEAPFNLMMRDDDETVGSPNVRNRQSYRVGYAATALGPRPTGSQFRRMTDPPKVLHPRIRQKARQIFRGCTTTAEKIDAVTKYFQTNYTYKLGLEVPPDQDPLNYFLLDASTGYCEYFASGAAVLLRLVRVPTRYVTGFLVTERGDENRTWIARNMDAHAWVEAWDQERGQWTIVEATTQDALGDASLADELVRDAGRSQPWPALLAQWIYEYGLFGVLGLAWHGHPALTLTGLAVLLFAAAAAIKVLRGAALPSASRRPEGFDTREGFVILRRLLAAMDRQAIRLGYRRRPDETLHAFAGRIRAREASVAKQEASKRSASHIRRCRSLADWYRQYADLRYRRELDFVHIEQLRRAVQGR